MVIAGGIQFHASAIHKNFEALKGVMSLNRGSLGELKLAAKNMTNEAEDEDKIIVYGKSLQAHAGVESKNFFAARKWKFNVITNSAPPRRCPSSQHSLRESRNAYRPELFQK